MTGTLIGHANLAKTATITATSFETALPPTLMANDICNAARAWQTLYGVTNASAEVTFADAALVRGVGIFKCNLSPYAVVTFTLWLGFSSEWTATCPGPHAGYGQVVALMNAPVTADRLTIEIDDPHNTDRYLNVPGLFAGDMWATEYSMDPTSNYDRDRRRSLPRTRGGQVYPTLLNQVRTFEFGLPFIPDVDAWLNLDRINLILGLGGNMLFVPDKQSVELNYEAVFGMLTGKPVSFGKGTPGYRSGGFKIEERL